LARITEQVDRFNAPRAQEWGVTRVILTLDDLDHGFKALLKRLKNDGLCQRGEPHPPFLTKAQWATIQKLARGEAL
jgi:hypothetical protein